MDDAELAAIRERSKVGSRGWFTRCRDDNAALLAEVDRLRAEVKRLESTIRTKFHIYQSMVRERQS